MSISLQCSFPGCDYTTKEVETELTACNLLNIHAFCHDSRNTTSNSKNLKLSKPNRPSVELNINDNQWIFFIEEWSRYKRRSNISDPQDLSDELLACCSLELRKTLFDFIGSTLSKLSEEDLLNSIKQCAVQGKSKNVHRYEFSQFAQEQNQSPQSYVASLKAKADLCCFSVKCKCENTVSYAEQMVIDQMITGLVDKQIQVEILTKRDEFKSFQEIFDRITALEIGKQSKVLMSTEGTNYSPTVNAVDRTRGKKSRMSSTNNMENNKPCYYCGKPRHPRDKCPARKSTCNNCKKVGHWETVCQQLKQAVSMLDNCSNSENEEDPKTCGTIGTIDEWKLVDRTRGRKSRMSSTNNNELSLLSKSYKYQNQYQNISNNHNHNQKITSTDAFQSKKEDRGRKQSHNLNYQYQNHYQNISNYHYQNIHNKNRKPAYDINENVSNNNSMGKCINVNALYSKNNPKRINSSHKIKEKFSSDQSRSDRGSPEKNNSERNNSNGITAVRNTSDKSILKINKNVWNNPEDKNRVVTTTNIKSDGDLC